MPAKLQTAMEGWFCNGGGSRNIFSEPLEQLASHNGADMYKYNMLYTFKINQDVLTPESF